MEQFSDAYIDAMARLEEIVSTEVHDAIDKMVDHMARKLGLEG